MSTKREIEWITNQPPKAGSVVIVTVSPREGKRWVAQAFWDGKTWREINWSGDRGDRLLTDTDTLIAWADVEPLQ